MHKILLFYTFIFLFLSNVRAQYFKIAQIKQVNDIILYQDDKKDLNGKSCALLKIQIPLSNLIFEGNVIESKYAYGEYWVYITNGTKQLNIKHQNYYPLRINFEEHGINITSKRVYLINLILENNNQEAHKELTIMKDSLSQMKKEISEITETNEHKFLRAKETDNFELMLLLAENDYPPAYFPVAQRYMKEGDWKNAQFWGKKAETVEEDRPAAKFLLIAAKQKENEYNNSEKMKKQRMKEYLLGKKKNE